jgi:hypothetical protein
VNERELVLSLPPHKEGEPIVVHYRHKPTGCEADGVGENFAEAKAIALADLREKISRHADTCQKVNAKLDRLPVL